MNNKIIILTGEIQTGKTTLLQQFCLRQNKIAGILTPIVNDKRMFYNISKKEFFEMAANGTEEQFRIGKYIFSAAAFTKANIILSNANKNFDFNYLLIDEIGPLEIKQQKGLFLSFKEILSSPFTYSLIIVIRQALVNEAITTFGFTDALVMNIDEMKIRFGLH